MNVVQQLIDIYGRTGERLSVSRGPSKWQHFVQNFGSGALDERFSFYSNLAKPRDIFDINFASKMNKDFLLFGDDMAGGLFGFIDGKDDVFMIDSSEPEELVHIANDFDAFLLEWFIEE